MTSKTDQEYLQKIKDAINKMRAKDKENQRKNEIMTFEYERQRAQIEHDNAQKLRLYLENFDITQR